jgi:hypothetical protein
VAFIRTGKLRPRRVEAREQEPAVAS